jgi:ubiquinone/menaquinone biosynthesis C-methylase UbiE
MIDDKPNNTYIYDVGHKDKLRLQIMNEIYNPSSQQELLDIGIRNKKCVIDMACGQGEMTCWMAQQVAPDGIVIGIDISDEQLTIARQLALRKKINNILFIKKSILDVDFKNLKNVLPMEPDLIYSRWLLIHIEIEKISQAMAALYELLGPGGIMAHEEVSLKDSYSENIAPSFDQYVKIFSELAAKLNINFDLGPLLPQLFSETGYSQPTAKIFKPKYTDEQLQYFQLDLESATPVLEKFNIIKKNDLEKLSKSIAQDLKNGHEMTMTNYFVYGYK